MQQAASKFAFSAKLEEGKEEKKQKSPPI